MLNIAWRNKRGGSDNRRRHDSNSGAGWCNKGLGCKVTFTNTFICPVSPVNLTQFSGFGVQNVSFDASQNYILSSGLDGVTRLWDLRKQRQVISVGGRIPRPCIANLAIFLQDQRMIGVASVYQGGKTSFT